MESLVQEIARWNRWKRESQVVCRRQQSRRHDEKSTLRAIVRGELCLIDRAEHALPHGGEQVTNLDSRCYAPYFLREVPDYKRGRREAVSEGKYVLSVASASYCGLRWSDGDGAMEMERWRLGIWHGIQRSSLLDASLQQAVHTNRHRPLSRREGLCRIRFLIFVSDTRDTQRLRNGFLRWSLRVSRELVPMSRASLMVRDTHVMIHIREL